ncbi:hypothetical protein HHL17_00630 [Chitinophaga sp. G-6-1-13]|uniref:Uncharacterized protein n=1 Tax=Chitinophaga fulva TaxID=2728842 RepID=A0A848GD53_9BACT|nr:hypothetical protein [Chitinophaga fulva]NML35687.1 hypothetical protein [Chitinophaga fulva]
MRGKKNDPYPPGQGWLRLTEDVGNQVGYAFINAGFPSTLGVHRTTTVTSNAKVLSGSTGTGNTLNVTVMIPAGGDNYGAHPHKRTDKPCLCRCADQQRHWRGEVGRQGHSATTRHGEQYRYNYCPEWSY